MEGCPKTQMINFDLKEPALIENAFEKPLSQYIQGFYHEDPGSYKNEIQQITNLRKNIGNIPHDIQGCKALRRYFTQLYYLQSRFPMYEGGEASVPFTWFDVYNGDHVQYQDIRYEQACILFNIGGLYSQLAGRENRASDESLKTAVQHFQSAAGAFQYLKDNYLLSDFVDMTEEILALKIKIMLGQAVECILEKSILENKNPTSVARIATQIATTFTDCVDLLGRPGTAEMGSDLRKAWTKHLKVKILSYETISHMYMGNNANTLEKFGEKVTYLKTASEKINEALKLLKSQTDETVNFIADVIQVQYEDAVKNNDFIYHMRVPDFATMDPVKGVDIVKPVPFPYDDKDVAGPDIFQRLVPMKAHEASSLYSEKKASLLRGIADEVEEKDIALSKYLSAMKVEDLLDPKEDKLPDDLQDKNKFLRDNPDVILKAERMVEELAKLSSELDGILKDSKNILNQEIAIDAQENSGREMGVLKDIEKELNECSSAHNEGQSVNMNLVQTLVHKKGTVQFLSGDPQSILDSLPSRHVIDATIEEPLVQRLREILGKVEKMKTQRQTLMNQLREELNKDDITGQLVVLKDSSQQNALFEEQMRKHDKTVGYLKQNLTAQENIIQALTEANAKYAATREKELDSQEQFDSQVRQYMNDVKIFLGIQDKIRDSGLIFFKDLEKQATILRQKIVDFSNDRKKKRPSKGAPAPSRPTARKPNLKGTFHPSVTPNINPLTAINPQFNTQPGMPVNSIQSNVRQPTQIPMQRPPLGMDVGPGSPIDMRQQVPRNTPQQPAMRHVSPQSMVRQPIAQVRPVSILPQSPQQKLVGGPRFPQDSGGPKFPQDARGPRFPQNAGGPTFPQNAGGPRFPQNAGGPRFTQDVAGSRFQQDFEGPRFPQQSVGPRFTQDAGGPRFKQEAGGPSFTQDAGRPRFPQQTLGPRFALEAGGPPFRQEVGSINFRPRGPDPVVGISRPQVRNQQPSLPRNTNFSPGQISGSCRPNIVSSESGMPQTSWQMNSPVARNQLPSMQQYQRPSTPDQMRMQRPPMQSPTQFQGRPRFPPTAQSNYHINPQQMQRPPNMMPSSPMNEDLPMINNSLPQPLVPEKSGESRIDNQQAGPMGTQFFSGPYQPLQPVIEPRQQPLQFQQQINSLHNLPDAQPPMQSIQPSSPGQQYPYQVQQPLQVQQQQPLQPQQQLLQPQQQSFQPQQQPLKPLQPYVEPQQPQQQALQPQQQHFQPQQQLLQPQSQLLQPQQQPLQPQQQPLQPQRQPLQPHPIKPQSYQLRQQIHQQQQPIQLRGELQPPQQFVSSQQPFYEQPTTSLQQHQQKFAGQTIREPSFASQQMDLASQQRQQLPRQPFSQPSMFQSQPPRASVQPFINNQQQQQPIYSQQMSSSSACKSISSAPSLLDTDNIVTPRYTEKAPAFQQPVISSMQDAENFQNQIKASMLDQQSQHLPSAPPMFSPVPYSSPYSASLPASLLTGKPLMSSSQYDPVISNILGKLPPQSPSLPISDANQYNMQQFQLQQQVMMYQNQQQQQQMINTILQSQNQNRSEELHHLEAQVASMKEQLKLTTEKISVKQESHNDMEMMLLKFLLNKQQEASAPPAPLQDPSQDPHHTLPTTTTKNLVNHSTSPRPPDVATDEANLSPDVILPRSLEASSQQPLKTTSQQPSGASSQSPLKASSEPPLKASSQPPLKASSQPPLPEKFIESKDTKKAETMEKEPKNSVSVETGSSSFAGSMQSSAAEHKNDLSDISNKPRSESLGLIEPRITDSAETEEKEHEEQVIRTKSEIENHVVASSVPPQSVSTQSVQPAPSKQVEPPKSVAPNIPSSPDELILPRSPSKSTNLVHPFDPSEIEKEDEKKTTVDPVKVPAKKASGAMTPADATVELINTRDLNDSQRFSPINSPSMLRKLAQYKSSSVRSSPRSSPNVSARSSARSSPISTANGQVVQLDDMDSRRHSEIIDHRHLARQLGRMSFYVGEPDEAAWRKHIAELAVKVEKFSNYCKSLCKPQPNTNIDGFKQIWDGLAKHEQMDIKNYTASAGEQNACKNRYRDILPWDHSRVKLTTLPNDYINATHVDNLTPHSPPYIATQGPIPQTFEDFWTMVWEQKSSVIVMLTNEVEGHKLKCHPYWSRDFENMKVEVLDEKEFTAWKIRSLKLTKDKETRLIRQFQFTSWPDYGTPKSPYELLSFMEEIHEVYQTVDPSATYPMILHCSAGVGRTGSFCCIHSAIKELEGQNGLIDVPGVIRKLRQCRQFMVQRMEQMIFCFHAICCFAQQFVDSERQKLADLSRNVSLQSSAVFEEGDFISPRSTSKENLLDVQDESLTTSQTLSSLDNTMESIHEIDSENEKKRLDGVNSPVDPNQPKFKINSDIFQSNKTEADSNENTK